ncbi:MAG: nitrogenase component 1 [Coriobacteriales bacterium]|nr:nitrogenase component 1 [Coriobacteriales bacterium]
MLKRLGLSATTAGQTTSAALFPSKLEFNPPAHGVWNIVHVGMLVPEAHQIYVCAINCMRGVTLTAAEMGASNRFSCVVLKEEDITRGTVEKVTLEGIAEVLRKLADRGDLPPCVIVFPVCTHHFLGVRMSRVYRELEREFPTVDFVRAFMDPIMKRRLSPDQRLRKAMFDPLRSCDADGHLVAFLGSDFALADDCELRELLQEGGFRLRELQDCTTYAEYRTLAQAGLFVATYPNARYGIEKLAARLGRPFLYLPSCFSYAQIQEQYQQLCDTLGMSLPDFTYEIARCEESLTALKELVGDTPIVIDASFHPRPLGLARLLCEHGFAVTEVYLDGINPEEEDDLVWLRENAPEVLLSSIVLPELRVATRTRDQKVLALGQKAVWFTGTSHFVNVVEGGGLWGFAGICAVASLMDEAWSAPKDVRDLIPRKGLGCASCF